MKTLPVFLTVLVFAISYGCKKSEMQKKVDEFVKVDLTTNINHLSENEKAMLPLLFEAARIMDEIFWQQAFGNKDELFVTLNDDATREFVAINYGPWERLKDNKPFIPKFGEKPLGANFYPADMTREEFEAFDSEIKTSQYTIIRRKADGNLEAIPYSLAYKSQHDKAAELLRRAAELAEDQGLRNYLYLRAEALTTDNYQPSDMAWMDMKTNNIDFICGPIENYEDALFNYKAAHEAFILIKDLEWSQKLSRFASLLPALQASLPVDIQYKAEIPGSDSDLGVYDAVYYAGDCNAGSKTIAINLPNDPEVHIKKGSRKLQLKNSMQYKFDKILVPISNLLIDPSQRKHVKFDAFFENVMFHEVAHGLGIKNTINGKGTVREAMKETYSPIEEAKADILGLYMVAKLVEMGEIEKEDLMDNYVTFMASIFRSIRFGAASAHGKANTMRFYYFQEVGAFTRNEKDGTYRVDFDKMTSAMNSLAAEIITIQGEGDYDRAKKMLEESSFIREGLQMDLNRISEANIPRDIRFNQGEKMLGLQ